jgi:hypothetical protein
MPNKALFNEYFFSPYARYEMALKDSRKTAFGMIARPASLTINKTTVTVCSDKTVLVVTNKTPVVATFMANAEYYKASGRCPYHYCDIKACGCLL